MLVFMYDAVRGVVYVLGVTIAQDLLNRSYSQEQEKYP